MSNETTKKEETKAVTKPEKGSQERDKQYNKQAVLIIVAILLLVSGMVAGGHYLWREINGIDDGLDSRFSELYKKEKAADEEIRRLNNNFHDLLQQIEDLQTKNEALNTALKQIYRQRSTSNDDYALSEIEYLLIIATHRLTLQKDVSTALTAMAAADNRLKGLGDPHIIDIREQLTFDINQLRSVNPVDITGLALYLADLIQRVDELPLRENIRSMPKAVSKEEPSTGEGGWRHVVSLIWQELKSLVVISQDKEISPVRLLPDEVYFLYQNLRIELANARLAALNRDTQNFLASLNNIIDWLNHYFDTREASVSNIQESLQHMRTLRLDPELPDISSSLESVRAYIRSKDEDM
ncbi:MAG: uroporphyrinogen-III C-methyltransferase, partial [Gammaproteobacteria bacterium]